MIRNCKQEAKAPEMLGVQDFCRLFPDNLAARRHFERVRWSDGQTCPHCGSDRFSQNRMERPAPYRCLDCRKHYSVTTGTMFHGRKLELRKCLYAVYLIIVAKKDISSSQMSRELGITQSAAWHLVRRIRTATDQDRAAGMPGRGGMPDGFGGFGATVGADEAFFGGKAMEQACTETESRDARQSGKGRRVRGAEPGRQAGRPLSPGTEEH